MKAYHVAALGMSGCSALAACGGSAEAEISGPLPPASAGSALFAASRNTELVVVGVDGNGNVGLLGSAIPDVTADSHEIRGLWTNADGSRAVVTVASKSDGPSFVVACDQTACRTIQSEETLNFGRVDVSEDLSFVWTWQATSDGWARPVWLTFEGDTLYEDPELRPFGDITALSKFAPDGSYAVMHHADSRELVLQTREGERHVLRTDLDLTSTGTSHAVRCAFPTSLVLADAYPSVEWVDPTGVSLQVEGFVNDHTYMEQELQVWGGMLSRLEDRQVVPLVEVPVDTTISHVRGGADGIGVVMSDLGGTVFIGPGAVEIGRYVPVMTFAQPLPPPLGRVGIEGSVILLGLDVSPRWVLFRADLSQSQGDVIVSLQTAWELVIIDPNVHVVSLVRTEDASAIPGFRRTPDGQHVFWLESDGLHRFAIGTETEDVIAVDAQLEEIEPKAETACE